MHAYIAGYHACMHAGNVYIGHLDELRDGLLSDACGPLAESPEATQGGDGLNYANANADICGGGFHVGLHRLV